MGAVLVQIDGYDPIAAAAVTLYAASHDDPAVCMLNGQTWMPALAKLPTLRYDLFDGAFGGAITTPSSSLTLQAEPWPNLGRYMLADARLRLWTGNVGAAWGSYTLRFDGRITGQPKLTDGKAEIDFAVDDRWLDTAFLATYAGTTGIEGPAGLKGQVKPLALGAPAYVPGKLVDSVNSVFQLSAYGGVQAINTALERLARFGAAAADYATYAALIAAALAPGTWATCKAAGLARFGAPPTGQVSFLVSGDNSGTDGWCRTPGKLIRRLALLSGGTGKVDDTSLNALDTARPYNLSLYLDEQTTAREAIQKIAASVNAVAGVSWTGQLFVLPVAIGAASVTLAADGSSLPPVGPVSQIDIAAPFKRLALTAERAWQVHQLSDIAFTATLIDLGGYAAGTTYREGNIVELPSGGRYMYSNITPTAGNSPPNATYWTVLPVAASTDFANVSGTTKPEPYATVSDNTIVNAGLATNTAPWTLFGSITRFGGSAGDPAPGYFFFPATVESYAWGNAAASTPLNGAQKVFVSGKIFANGALAGNAFAIVYWRRADGSAASTAQTNTSVVPVTNGSWQDFAFSLTPPADASHYYFGAYGNANANGFSMCAFRAASTQSAADVTAQSQVSIDGPATMRVAASSAGVPLADTTVGYKRLLGSTDVSASTTWSIASSSGCTVSVTTAGVVSRSGALGLNGKFTLRTVRDGLTKDLAVTFIRDDAAPTSSTGSGGNPGTPGSGDVNSTTTSNGYGSCGTECAFTCVAGTAGQVALSINLDVFGNRSSGAPVSEYAYAKIQWRAVAGTWADVAAETQSTAQATYGQMVDDCAGATIAISTSKTGLTSGTTYEFRCLARRGGSSTAVTVVFYGTLTGTGS